MNVEGYPAIAISLSSTPHRCTQEMKEVDGKGGGGDKKGGGGRRQGPLSWKVLWNGEGEGETHFRTCVLLSSIC